MGRGGGNEVGRIKKEKKEMRRQEEEGGRGRKRRFVVSHLWLISVSNWLESCSLTNHRQAAAST